MTRLFFFKFYQNDLCEFYCIKEKGFNSCIFKYVFHKNLNIFYDENICWLTQKIYLLIEKES